MTKLDEQDLGSLPDHLPAKLRQILVNLMRNQISYDLIFDG
jgi:hypothetical protein